MEARPILWMIIPCYNEEKVLPMTAPMFTQKLAQLADSGRISQVIYNLVGNAMTYTGADRTVHVRQTTGNGRARISVQDTGDGIAPEELPWIWDRYYRSRENHKRAVIGSGLGLNICRGILEQHEAPYGVENGPEGGTVFWFELPYRKEPASPDDHSPGTGQ